MIWYEDDVKAAELEKTKLDYEPKLIFYGSSSIRLWDSLYQCFAMYHPLNLGFGGSTLAACDWYFNRLLQNCHPSHLVFYAGDNDLGDGRRPEEVFIFFEQFVTSFNNLYPGSTFTFISIKPSIARWAIVDDIRTTNSYIENYIHQSVPNAYYLSIFDNMLGMNGLPMADLFEQDGLHLSQKGYNLWNEILMKHLKQIIKIQ